MRSERSYQPLTPRFHPLIHKLQFLYKKYIIDLFMILCEETNYEIYWKMLIRKYVLNGIIESHFSDAYVLYFDYMFNFILYNLSLLTLGFYFTIR